MNDPNSHLNYIILPIDGMTCASCSARIQKNLSELDWVESVDVNLAAEQAAIGFFGPVSKAVELKDNIVASGYKVRTRSSEIIIPGFNDPTQIQTLQKELCSIPGLENARFNSANETLTLEHIPGIVSVPQVEKTVSKLTGAEIVWHDSLPDNDLELEKERTAQLKKQTRHSVSAVIFAVVTFILTMPHFFGFITIIPQSYRLLTAFVLTSWAIFFAGKDIYRHFLKKLKPGKSDMNTLVGMGAGTAWLYSTVVMTGKWISAVNFDQYPLFFDSAAFIIGFILLGRTLESRARRQTGRALSSLAKLQPVNAQKIVKGKALTIAVKKLQQNDECLVKNGERIPADGILVSEIAEIDESMLSGENLPVTKNQGQLLLSGTINSGGELRLKVLKTGGETALGQIVQWVRKAQNTQPPVQKFVDKVAAVFVPSVIGAALITLAIWLISGAGLSLSLMHFINVIVIACPCALGLATPTAIIVTMGSAAKKGILIKDAAVLQNLLKVNTVLFDKTGTLTTGKLSFNLLKVFKRNENSVLQITASLEKNATHPIAKAILNYTKSKNISVKKTENVEMLTGFGIRAKIDDQVYGIGNRKLMLAMGVVFTEDVEKEISGFMLTENILIYIACQKELLAVMILSDVIREEAAEVISELIRKDITAAMVTGDNEKTAKAIAAKLNINSVFAEQPPQVKGSVVNQLQRQGNKVLMIGDGINDALALSRADVGIALAEGTEVAIDAADIVFLKADLTLLLKTLKLTKRTERIIKQNLFWAFGYNLLMLPSAAGLLYLLFGIAFNPAFAALAMAMSSVSVVMNSLRLKKG
jgi:Cu+-exporting ATPase